MREPLFTLTRSQREDLWRRYKQAKERRVAERIHAIMLLDEGCLLRDVSTILHVHSKTLQRWIRLFANAGIDGLCSFNYFGSSPALDAFQLQQLTTWLDQQVHSTKETIAWVDTQFGIDYTENGMLKLLKRLGYSINNPYKCLPKQIQRLKRHGWKDTVKMRFLTSLGGSLEMTMRKNERLTNNAISYIHP